ncbi:MAG: Mur ligase family protein, partial [Oligoflexia bacterium]|nr:Mur ligase family protein [Oligoflexia bacterium]
ATFTLEQLRKVHIIGVCGTLMGAFAAYLKRRGIEVTGSDQNVYPPMSDILRQAGVELFNGYRPENITTMARKPDLVVIGNVIPGSNPEARAAIDGGFAYTSLPEAMEKLILPETRNLVVAGTHGKTTTSSMLAHTLVEAGKDPGYFIGGVSLDLPYSFNVTGLEKGRCFVLEGDEYDTAFWDKVPKFNHYLPDDVILTSVEYDHADIYPDFAAVMRAFAGLLTRIRPGGALIACHDYASIRELVGKARWGHPVELITYGTTAAPGVRYTPGKITVDGGKTRFEVVDHQEPGGRPVDEITLNVPGNHNIANALAVWIQCKRLGIPAAAVRNGLARFRGVKRRQEERGEVRGVLVIDDFAHHPTAVRETLRALRMKYPGRRLISVFEPRSATSRRKVFQKDYVAAFGEADLVFIAKPYDQSRIKADDQFSSDQLIGDLVALGKNAELMVSVAEGVPSVARKAKSGDLIAVLSNGGFEGFIPKLLEELKRDA